MDRSLSSFDANLLVALDALLEERNVARAARRVGISPSAMSHALARIRELLADPILVRAGRKMIPTPRAAELAPSLHDGFSLIRKALAPPRGLDLPNIRHTLRIGAVDFAQNHLLPMLVAALRAEAPHVDVVVLTAGPSVFEELKAGELDLAIAGAGPVAGLSRHVLAEEPFVCVARRGHPGLGGRMTAKRFAALEHVLISPRGRVVGATDNVLKRSGLKRRVALVVPTFLAAAVTVADSDLVLTCAERSAKHYASWFDLHVFPPPLALPPFPVALFWHPRSEHDAFFAFVRARLGQLAL